MAPRSKLPAAIILVVLGGSLMLVGGFWFGALLIACGLVGLFVTYRQGGSRRPGVTPLDRDWTRRQAVLWALAVSGGGPVGTLIANAIQGDLSWGLASVLLVVWAVLFALFLLSVWGKVRPRQRNQ